MRIAARRGACATAAAGPTHRGEHRSKSATAAGVRASMRMKVHGATTAHTPASSRRVRAHNAVHASIAMRYVDHTAAGHPH